MGDVCTSQETPGQMPAETTAGTLEFTAVPERSLATLHKSVSSPWRKSSNKKHNALRSSLWNVSKNWVHICIIFERYITYYTCNHLTLRFPKKNCGRAKLNAVFFWFFFRFLGASKDRGALWQKLVSWFQSEALSALRKGFPEVNHQPTQWYGCFLTWWYPHFTPQNDHFLVGFSPWVCWGNPPF